jgi:hypothetical protein
MKQVESFPDRIVAILSLGESLPRIWAIYFGFGGVTFGMLSYPSKGTAVALIPLFLLSGVITLYGCTFAAKRDKTLDLSRKIISYGLALMILAAWTRAILVYGLVQQTAGSQILASAVWIWITIGSTFLLISIWQRGVR